MTDWDKVKENIVESFKETLEKEVDKYETAYKEGSLDIMPDYVSEIQGQLSATETIIADVVEKVIDKITTNDK